MSSSSESASHPAGAAPPADEPVAESNDTLKDEEPLAPVMIDRGDGTGDVVCNESNLKAAFEGRAMFGYVLSFACSQGIRGLVVWNRVSAIEAVGIYCRAKELKLKRATRSGTEEIRLGDWETIASLVPAKAAGLGIMRRLAKAFGLPEDKHLFHGKALSAWTGQPMPASLPREPIVLSVSEESKDVVVVELRARRRYRREGEGWLDMDSGRWQPHRPSEFRLWITSQKSANGDGTVWTVHVADGAATVSLESLNRELRLAVAKVLEQSGKRPAILDALAEKLTGLNTNEADAEEEKRLKQAASAGAPAVASAPPS